MSVNVRRSLAVQLVPVGGSNPLKMRISNNAGFVVSTAGTTAALIAQGGVPAYAYSITSGSLPTGLSLNSSTGIISGTPSAVGNFSFTAQVQDSALTVYNAIFSLRVANPLSINPNLPCADSGVAYSYQVPVIGATGTVTFTAAGPNRGLSISTTGLITGTPITGVPAVLSTTATDSGTGASLSMTLGIQIFTTGFLFIPGTTLAATVGATTSQTYSITTNVGPFTASTSMANVVLTMLNAGNRFTAAGCSFRIDFTPAAANYPLVTQSGNISVVVTDSYGLTTTLNLPFSVANPNAPNQTASTSQTGQLAASDFTNFSAKAGSLSSFGATPNSAGASLTGGVLTLQPANATFPGGLSASDWNTFNKKSYLLFINTSVPAGNTISNTTATTAFTSKATLPATITAGTVIRVKANGVYGTTGTPTMQLQVTIASATVVVGVPVITLPATVTNNAWTLEADIVFLTSTTAECQGEIRYQSTATTALDVMLPNTAATSQTLQGASLEMHATWGTANAANTITLRQFLVEILPQ